MTKKSAREWLAAILLCILGTFMVGGLIAALEHHGYASSEAAGWIQAIGSVFAVFIAIYIMREQERSRKIESLTAARIALAAMIPALYRLLDTVGEVGEVFQDMAAKKDGGHRFPDCLHRLKSLLLWDVTELARLGPLPEGVAYKATQMVAIFHMTVHHISEKTGNPSVKLDSSQIELAALKGKIDLDMIFTFADEILKRADAELWHLK